MMQRDDIHIFRKHNRYLAASLALVVMLLGAEATSWAATGDESGAAPAVQADRAAAGPITVAQASGLPSMAERYAARETSSKKLETFKGGDVVIIGSTTLVIVLLVVLILVVA